MQAQANGSQYGSHDVISAHPVPGSTGGHGKSTPLPNKIQLAARFDPSSDSSDFSTDTTSSLSSDSDDDSREASLRRPGQEQQQSQPLHHYHHHHHQQQHEPWFQKQVYQPQVKEKVQQKHLSVTEHKEHPMQTDVRRFNDGHGYNLYSESKRSRDGVQLLPPVAFQQETNGKPAPGGYPYAQPVGQKGESGTMKTYNYGSIRTQSPTYGGYLEEEDDKVQDGDLIMRKKGIRSEDRPAVETGLQYGIPFPGKCMSDLQSRQMPSDPETGIADSYSQGYPSVSQGRDDTSVDKELSEHRSLISEADTGDVSSVSSDLSGVSGLRSEKSSRHRGIGRGNFGAIKSSVAHLQVGNSDTVPRSSSDTTMTNANRGTARQDSQDSPTGGSNSSENFCRNKWHGKSDSEGNPHGQGGYTYRGKFRSRRGVGGHHHHHHKSRAHGGKKFHPSKHLSREDKWTTGADVGKPSPIKTKAPGVGGQELMDSDPETKKKPQMLQMNEKELLRTEYDWQKHKIERKVKMVLNGLSENKMSDAVHEIEKILNTGVAELAKFPWPKHLFIALDVIISYGVEDSTAHDTVCILIQHLEGLHAEGFDQQISQVLCKKMGEYIKPSGAKDQQLLSYSRLLGKLYLMAVMSTSGLKKQVSACVHSSIEKWISFNKQGQNPPPDVLETYTNCLTALLKVIGSYLDRCEEKLAGQYVDMIRERILTETNVPRTVREKLLDFLLLRAVGWDNPVLKTHQSVENIALSDTGVNTDSVDTEDTSVQVQSIENPVDVKDVGVQVNDIENAIVEGQGQFTAPDCCGHHANNETLEHTVPETEKPVAAASSPYGNVRSMLTELNLEEQFDKFVENGIRDSVLMADWNDLKSLLKECGFLPGTILEIQIYLRNKRQSDNYQKLDSEIMSAPGKDRKKVVPLSTQQPGVNAAVNLAMAAKCLPTSIMISGRHVLSSNGGDNIQGNVTSAQCLSAKETCAAVGITAEKEAVVSESAEHDDENWGRCEEEEVENDDVVCSAVVNDEDDDGGGGGDNNVDTVDLCGDGTYDACVDAADADANDDDADDDGSDDDNIERSSGTYVGEISGGCDRAPEDQAAFNSEVLANMSEEARKLIQRDATLRKQMFHQQPPEGKPPGGNLKTGTKSAVVTEENPSTTTERHKGRNISEWNYQSLPVRGHQSVDAVRSHSSDGESKTDKNDTKAGYLKYDLSPRAMKKMQSRQRDTVESQSDSLHGYGKHDKVTTKYATRHPGKASSTKTFHATENQKKSPEKQPRQVDGVTGHHSPPKSKKSNRLRGCEICGSNSHTLRACPVFCKYAPSSRKHKGENPEEESESVATPLDSSEGTSSGDDTMATANFGVRRVCSVCSKPGHSTFHCPKKFNNFFL